MNPLQASSIPERQAQLLVEIAVVYSPIPAHRDGVPAHHALSCSWVERIHQQLQITLASVLCQPDCWNA